MDVLGVGYGAALESLHRRPGPLLTRKTVKMLGVCAVLDLVIRYSFDSFVM